MITPQELQQLQKTRMEPSFPKEKDRSEYHRKYREQNRERIREMHRAYTARNRAKLRERARQRRLAKNAPRS